ncbi:MAG: TonB-dependent receptor [Gemmatimonadetes bacterium]|nr:TonB-dependent receptor [Gemmatimonadota bacterium]
MALRTAPAAALLMLLTQATLLGAQRPDSAAALPPIRVSVTRSPDSLARLGASVTVVDSLALRRGRLAGGLDEALAFVPGVIAANRGNPSVDQRLIIRGFGARAAFGVRGLKILVDGIPQTLPDGQSQLTNLDLGGIERIEVLRGAASSLYGNAAGGVIAFTSRSHRDSLPRLQLAVENLGGAHFRSEAAFGMRRGRFTALLSGSGTRLEGYRAHSLSEQQRLQYALAYRIRATTSITARAALANDPDADNPGALTAAEVASDPDLAAPNNLLRNAGKAVRQKQFSLGLDDARGDWTSEVRLWLLTRSLENPLAAPAPAPNPADEGLWVGLDRLGGGLRASTTRRWGQHQVTAGVDLQSSRDDRVNRRHRQGTPFGPLLLDQRETVGEAGLFAQATIVRGAWQLRSGVRWDHTSFDVADALGSGSGARSMAAVSGSASLTRAVGRATTWASLSTAFETPTTTELANRPDGSTGLNRVLDPQRSVSMEVGVRSSLPFGQIEASAWATATQDAITPFQDVGGRSFYTNAGKTRTRGVEAAAQASLRPGIMGLATVTVTDATFRDYLLNGVRLDGRRIAGIPRAVARLGVRGTVARIGFDIDHALASSQYGDDANTLEAAGWGAGITGVRLRWIARGRHAFAPFVTAQNLFNRRVIGSRR